jgi:hypothetical protein
MDQFPAMLVKGLQSLEDLVLDVVPAVKQLRASWTRALAHLLSFTPTDVAHHPHLPTKVEDIVAQLMADSSGPATRLVRTMFGTASADRCHGPSCVALRISPDANFETCGDCRFAKYCSRACQKAA